MCTLIKQNKCYRVDDDEKKEQLDLQQFTQSISGDKHLQQTQLPYKYSFSLTNTIIDWPEQVEIECL